MFFCCFFYIVYVVVVDVVVVLLVVGRLALFYMHFLLVYSSFSCSKLFIIFILLSSHALLFVLDLLLSSSSLLFRHSSFSSFISEMWRGKPKCSTA